MFFVCCSREEVKEQDPEFNPLVKVPLGADPPSASKTSLAGDGDDDDDSSSSNSECGAKFGPSSNLVDGADGLNLAMLSSILPFVIPSKQGSAQSADQESRRRSRTRQ